MNYSDYIRPTVDVLREGKVILCPSDTIASLSCDATNAAAIRKINEIKERPKNKSYIVLVSSLTMLEAYVSEIPEAAYQLIEVSDTPTTVIFSDVRNLPQETKHEDGSVGFRVVTEGFMGQLLARFRKPLVSTSVNLSGMPPAIRVADANPLISRAVDMIIELEEYKDQPSSIVKFDKKGSIKIIRK